MKRKPFKKRSQRIQESNNRRSKRYALLGRELEIKVSNMLEKKIKENRLDFFAYNKPFSHPDLEGKDFTVGKRINGLLSIRHFGITISLKGFCKHQIKHLKVPCILIPLEMSEERIWERIENFFLV